MRVWWSRRDTRSDAGVQERPWRLGGCRESVREPLKGPLGTKAGDDRTPAQPGACASANTTTPNATARRVERARMALRWQLKFGETADDMEVAVGGPDANARVGTESRADGRAGAAHAVPPRKAAAFGSGVRHPVCRASRRPVAGVKGDRVRGCRATGVTAPRAVATAQHGGVTAGAQARRTRRRARPLGTGRRGRGAQVPWTVAERMSSCSQAACPARRSPCAAATRTAGGRRGTP